MILLGVILLLGHPLLVGICMSVFLCSNAHKVNLFFGENRLTKTSILSRCCHTPYVKKFHL